MIPVRSQWGRNIIYRCSWSLVNFHWLFMDFHGFFMDLSWIFHGFWSKISEQIPPNSRSKTSLPRRPSGSASRWRCTAKRKAGHETWPPWPWKKRTKLRYYNTIIYIYILCIYIYIYTMYIYIQCMYIYIYTLLIYTLYIYICCIFMATGEKPGTYWSLKQLGFMDVPPTQIDDNRFWPIGPYRGFNKISGFPLGKK